MKQLLLISLLFFSGFVFSQNGTLVGKKIIKVADSVQIEPFSIRANGFKVETKTGQVLDSTFYVLNPETGRLKFIAPIEEDSLVITYKKYPEFLTRIYKGLDKNLIVEANTNQQKLYQLRQPNQQTEFRPFDGLTTSGSIARGVTVGNNQNSVLNSELDLQITGKLSEKVSLRASIQDANAPLQESGYSQRLDEFDQVFIELYSDKWAVRAGDIDLINDTSYFSKFTKRVQGLLVSADLGNEETSTNVFGAGALVRGQFSSFQITGEEGNQGPYKLQGNNGELFVLIVSGSETVYVNGIALKRGESEDYIIDYNAGEIIFNSTYPITSEMRITVDFQFSERNYSRIVAYGGGAYKTEKLTINASVYSENDSKNNPLQQNLNEEQVEVLSNAGDDRSLMVANSEVAETFNENRILYRKEVVGTEIIYIFSNNPDDELFSVRFTNVGDGNGNYVLANTNAITNIYEYVPPVGGVPQGEFEPIVQLVAPTKLQIGIVNGLYRPNNKTEAQFELAVSKNDLNLFSDLDDENNNGAAGKLRIKRAIVKNDSLWTINAIADLDIIEQNFKTIQRLYRAEFNRDWNLDVETLNPTINLGNQTLFTLGLEALNFKKGFVNYSFDYLNYKEAFTGTKHNINASYKLDKLAISTNNSLLNTNEINAESSFFRTYNNAIYDLNKLWLGARFSSEENKKRRKNDGQFTALTQRFVAYEAYTGVGDSTKVFAQLGYKYRVNDSITNFKLDRVNSSNTYYLNSKLIQNDRTNLGLFVNYRTLSFTNPEIKTETSLNSRLQYNQKLFKNFVQSNTIFETNSGSLPQQDFTYVEVDPGQGVYIWIDYNNNGIQELEEFEVAQFQDQGTYIRVLLPNQVFIKTHQNRLSQTLTLNPLDWINSESATKKFLSHFYNQSSYLVDRKTRKVGNNFSLNPFDTGGEDPLGLQLSFRNTIFYNRGKQKYTTSYTYQSNKATNTLSFGKIESELESHQVNFSHKFQESWLFTLENTLANTTSSSENFSSKDFNIDSQAVFPKISYLVGANTHFDLFYQFLSKENSIGNLETLKQHKYGVSFGLTGKDVTKGSINGELNFINNTFEGDSNSPVGYQLLEGLQPGKNLTWNLIAQKKLTKYLDLNLSYFGRKTETSNTIHTGNIQLKAYF
ncbi:hypothetical protein [Aurantibacter aestuarii]|uniref:Uncharacterized protein n=1 Tax=Aurantibacter aestuarii TaxID=1266046 RepID=A0A2T1NCM8_9FLAO|nr:hypothetical protein [Aurantibacter aestuarii]PSG90167.1 hypothetical protein C7H52_02505 [Aurantibacter aestuarii]